MAFIDLSHQRFGRLRVLEFDGTKSRDGSARWRCECDCGVQCVVVGKYLRNGSTKSCGCLHREAPGGFRITHGATRRTTDPALRRTYDIWEKMRERCHNPKASNWSYYGARGISVCHRWNSFEGFLADMGIAPVGRSIDRVNNDGNYEPGNCIWSTQQTQNRNRRWSHKITVPGHGEMLAIEACERFGVSYPVVVGRVNYLRKIGHEATYTEIFEIVRRGEGFKRLPRAED